MEGSESEAIFESLNLNPQLFLNETLNIVDDLLDNAFDFYLQYLSPSCLFSTFSDIFSRFDFPLEGL